MAVVMFKGTGTITAAGGGAAVNVAHGLGVIPTSFFVIPRTLSPAVAALITVTPTADITNVILTPNVAPAADIVFDVLAWVNATVADEAAALLNTAHAIASGASHANVADATLLLTRTNAAPRPQALVNVPVAFPVRRIASVTLADIAGSGTFAYTLAALKVAFPTIEFDNEPVSLWVDNPALMLAWTGGLFATGLTITNRSTVTTEGGILTVQNAHSLRR